MNQRTRVRMVLKNWGEPMHLISQVPEHRLLRIKGRARAGSERTVSRKLEAGAEPANPADAAECPNSSDQFEERRRSNRVAKRADIMIRRVGGISLTVQMQDISNGGCKVQLADPYAVGDPAITRLPQLEPLGSRICWVNGMTAGVQFLTTIYPAVFNALLDRMDDRVAA